jgi:hypothetical protein
MAKSVTPQQREHERQVAQRCEGGRPTVRASHVHDGEVCHAVAERARAIGSRSAAKADVPREAESATIVTERRRNSCISNLPLARLGEVLSRFRQKAGMTEILLAASARAVFLPERVLVCA